MQVEGNAQSEAVIASLQQLAPATEQQKLLKTQALSKAMEIMHTRRLLFAERESSVPLLLLVVLAIWLTIIFLSLGLFAPFNATVVVVFLLCAISVAGAVGVVLELDHPLTGFIKVSDESMRRALEQLGR